MMPIITMLVKKILRKPERLIECLTKFRTFRNLYHRMEVKILYPTSKKAFFSAFSTYTLENTVLKLLNNTLCCVENVLFTENH